MNGRIGLAVVMLWMGQLLAYALVFSFHPYYAVYTEQPERPSGSPRSATRSWRAS